jgi:hypothetical protein
LRKLTSVYYLNPSWSASLGGLFRIHHAPPDHDKFTDLEPIADRLIVFWCVCSTHISSFRFMLVLLFALCSTSRHSISVRSDDLVHSVTPSYAPRGANDYRWSMTVWVSMLPHLHFVEKCRVVNCYQVPSTSPSAISNDSDAAKCHFGAPS